LAFLAARRTVGFPHHDALRVLEADEALGRDVEELGDVVEVVEAGLTASCFLVVPSGPGNAGSCAGGGEFHALLFAAVAQEGAEFHVAPYSALPLRPRRLSTLRIGTFYMV
jgi:hypothetical protein